MYLDEISELGLRLACSIARPAAVRVSSALDTVAMLSTHFGQSAKKLLQLSRESMKFADKSMVATSRAPLWCLPELSNGRVWCDVEHLGGPGNGHGPDWLARCGFDHVQKLGFELPAILLVSPPGNLVDLTVRGTSVVNGELFSRFASVSAIKWMCFPKVFFLKTDYSTRCYVMRC